MKYYYVNAAGASAGPESLEALCAMAATGAITLATMVVPVGGEDWTPLARVLRFYYTDGAGATLGPVAFSEINRLHQVGALAADAWILEEGGSEWKALAGVLTAAGAPVSAPPSAAAGVRTATGAFKPQAASARAGADPYAAPKSGQGGPRVVRHYQAGGINRLQYFLFSLLLHLVTFGVIYFLMSDAFKALLTGSSEEDIETILKSGMGRHVAVISILLLIMFIGGVVLMFQRIKNIGWPWYWLLFLFVPIVSIWMTFALVAYPPGYVRHKRFDTATKVIAAVMVLVFIASIAFMLVAMPKLAKKLEATAKVVKSTNLVSKVSADLRQYEMDHRGELPSQDEGLRSLITGGILKSEADYTDAWGQPLLYRLPGTRSKDKFDLFSKGPDTKAGTEDDIGNWSVDSK